MIILRIPGKPNAAKRPRFNRFRGIAYMADADIKDSMSFHIKSQYDRPLIQGACALEVVYNFQLPASLSRKKRAEQDGSPCLKKWDLDNGLKILMDSMLGIVFNDDSQVTAIRAVKRWIAEDPYTLVGISTPENWTISDYFRVEAIQAIQPAEEIDPPSEINSLG
jgi:Holliday junction resolvase RusA-like endonuclease